MATDRSDLFKEVYALISTLAPSYDYNSTTYTFSILSAFPEINPTFPCIVINPARKKTKSLGVSWGNDSKSRSMTVDIDFYTPVSHGKGVIDSARDEVEDMLNDTKSSVFLLVADPFDDSNVDKIDYNGQSLNAATLTMFCKMW